MSKQGSFVEASGFGKWKIEVYKAASDTPLDAVLGELIIDNQKYYIVDETGAVLLVVPAGNVAFAINLMKDIRDKL